jgi:cysteine desulfurase/selenocysteine lyase
MYRRARPRPACPIRHACASCDGVLFGLAGRGLRPRLRASGSGSGESLRQGCRWRHPCLLPRAIRRPLGRRSRVLAVQGRACRGLSLPQGKAPGANLLPSAPTHVLSLGNRCRRWRRMPSRRMVPDSVTSAAPALEPRFGGAALGVGVHGAMPGNVINRRCVAVTISSSGYERGSRAANCRTRHDVPTANRSACRLLMTCAAAFSVASVQCSTEPVARP